jgi:hypothetical protein
MSDPGGGHAWRSERHMPRRRGGVLGLAQLADRAERSGARALCVLLLPHALEAIADRERLDDLLGGPGVVAVDPARVSYRALGRLPGVVQAGLAAGQARRLNLPGTPRAVVVFGGLQYPLARSLLADHADAELWLAEPPEGPPAGTPARLRARVEELASLAALRADLRFAWPGGGGGAARTRNAELWERMERLGVESGRLGSERPGVRRSPPGS